VGFENGKLLRVTLRASFGALQMVNTLHYDLDDSGTWGGGANDVQDLADRFRDVVIPTYKALYEPTWTIDPVVIVQEKDPLNPTAARSSWTSGGSVVGTHELTTDRLNYAMTPVVKLSTPNIGRRFRGRMFVGGNWSEDNHGGNGVIAGTDAAGTRKLILDFVNSIPRQPDIAGGISEAEARWCVYSRTQRAADLDPYASRVTGMLLRTHFYWQRRRAITG